MDEEQSSDLPEVQIVAPIPPGDVEEHPVTYPKLPTTWRGGRILIVAASGARTPAVAARI